MCELASIENVKVCRAKRDYRCVECSKPIPKGAQYESYGGLWEGEWSTYRTCIPCRDLREAMRPIKRKAYGEDCFQFGSLRSDIEELRTWSDESRTAIEATLSPAETKEPT